jgi:hypothetical protein
MSIKIAGNNKNKLPDDALARVEQQERRTNNKHGIGYEHNVHFASCDFLATFKRQGSYLMHNLFAYFTASSLKGPLPKCIRSILIFLGGNR